MVVRNWLVDVKVMLKYCDMIKVDNYVIRCSVTYDGNWKGNALYTSFKTAALVNKNVQSELLSAHIKIIWICCEMMKVHHKCIKISILCKCSVTY